MRKNNLSKFCAAIVRMHEARKEGNIRRLRRAISRVEDLRILLTVEDGIGFDESCAIEEGISKAIKVA